MLVPNALFEMLRLLERRVSPDDRREFLRDRAGATAIEYGLLAAGISVVIIGTVFTLGDTLLNTFQNVVDTLTNAGGGTP